MMIEAEKTADRLIDISCERAGNIETLKKKEFYEEIANKSAKAAERNIKQRLTIEKQVELSRAFLNRLEENEAR